MFDEEDAIDGDCSIGISHIVVRFQVLDEQRQHSEQLNLRELQFGT